MIPKILGLLALAGTLTSLQASGADKGSVYHIVCFRFKSDPASQAKIPGVIQAFADLQTQAVAADGRRLITSFHYGVNNSTEQVSFGPKGVPSDRGTEYDFIMTFANVSDRDYYVSKEAHHQAFKKLVGTLLPDGANSVFVTDFVQ